MWDSMCKELSLSLLQALVRQLLRIHHSIQEVKLTTVSAQPLATYFKHPIVRNFIQQDNGNEIICSVEHTLCNTPAAMELTKPGTTSLRASDKTAAALAATDVL